MYFPFCKVCRQTYMIADGCACDYTKPHARQPFSTEHLEETLSLVSAELDRALVWPDFNSMYEGYGVLAEEIVELSAHVWCNQSKRDLAAMEKEAVQVAAMACRMILDCVGLDRDHVEDRRVDLFDEIGFQYPSANARFNSAHEAWAMLTRAEDQLWDAIKTGRPIRDPALEVAITATRFIMDICNAEYVLR